MTSYFDHNAHITRRDKTQSATSWDVLDMPTPIKYSRNGTTTVPSEHLWKVAKALFEQMHTYSGKKAGER